ncbi:MAG: ABC transporter permease [Oscillospiraceae bacterium]|nr:ABC transporter permease [Oscillospiraceae bacterium]
MDNRNKSFYEMLKQDAAKEENKSGEMKLDDIARVKVLSPGRQVFKRFVRNRLAVFGACLLIVMFVFSFLGPLVYPYGQKQIFYKYDAQNVNYALAKENSTYNGYVLDSSFEVERSVNNLMNSSIKRMLEDGKKETYIFGDEVWHVEERAEEVYVLSLTDSRQICVTGSGKLTVGNFDTISGKLNYSSAEVEGLEEAAAAANMKGSGGSFTYDGVTYDYARSGGKSYDITTELSGVNYSAEAPGEGFEQAMEKAVGKDDCFEFGGSDYAIMKDGQRYYVYSVENDRAAKVFTRLTFDLFEPGNSVSDEMRVGALMNTDGSFTADGREWTAADEDGLLIIRGDDGKEFAEMNTFSIRRYSGADTVEYDLKKAITETVEQMQDEGNKTAELVYRLPQQSETGEYAYDEDGSLLYQDTELHITQRDTGEYVINCDQIIYVIDRFAGPSIKHVLGTDGDGFDVMSRIMYGGRVSLMVGFVVVFIEVLIGVIMGGLAGYYGGWVDNLIMRLVDIFYCLPSLPIMIILGAMMDALRLDTRVRLLVMMATLGVLGWASVARLVRGQILSLREQEFMVAAEATGIKVKDRIFRHLVPNVMPQLIVIATMGMGSVIIMESTLSYLGLGVKHPLATWGTIINSVSSASAMAHYAHIWIPVGLLICVTVIAFNFVGDGMRDAYDPKSKG